jgi:hypothetical protein
MKTWAVALTFLLIANVVVAVTNVVAAVTLTTSACAPAARSPALARGCAAAAGDVRVVQRWLTPGHPRRDAALLRLVQLAAWAPVCAARETQGLILRDQIRTEVSGTDDLTTVEQLLAILESAS